MNEKEYYQKMLALIKKDYTIMLKMLKNADPAKVGITKETIPALHAVKEVFIDTIERNIESMLQFKTLAKVLSNGDLNFDEKTLEWEMDTDVGVRKKNGVKTPYV